MEIIGNRRKINCYQTGNMVLLLFVQLQTTNVRNKAVVVEGFSQKNPKIRSNTEGMCYLDCSTSYIIHSIFNSLEKCSVFSLLFNECKRIGAFLNPQNLTSNSISIQLYKVHTCALSAFRGDIREKSRKVLNFFCQT